MRVPQFDEEGNPIEPEEPELEEGEEKSYEGFVPNPDIFPASVLVLKGNDDFLISRVRNLDENTLKDTHYNHESMIRRLKAYRTANNSEVAEPSV